MISLVFGEKPAQWYSWLRSLGLVTLGGLLLGLPSLTYAQSSYKVGSFTKSTNTSVPASQVVPHGLGETPKALILWTNGKTSESISGSFLFGWGMTDGTTDKSMATASVDAALSRSRRYADKALTIVQGGQVLLAEADLSSWDATNFTLSWTTNNTSGYVVHFIAIGGSAVSAKVKEWTVPTTVGNQAVSGVGFNPDVVIHSHLGPGFTTAAPSNMTGAGLGLGVMDVNSNEWALASRTAPTGVPSRAARVQKTNACLTWTHVDATSVPAEASFVSMDTDGFTTNFSTVSGNVAYVVSLALKGIDWDVGSFSKSTNTTTPASQPVTGLGITPKALLLASFQDSTRASPVDHDRFGIGASDGTTEGSSARQDADNVNPSSVDGVDKTSKIFVKVDNDSQTIDAEADLTSLDSAGFTLSWTTNDAVGTEMLYLALGSMYGIITVDTTSDVVDGDTTSIDSLAVNKGADGKISLREAIWACNNTVGPDSIRFAIGSGLQTIPLSAALPPITDKVVIDGTTQPGFAADPLIELDGNLAGAGVDGISLSGTSDGSVIRSLVIKRCTRDGVLIQAGADSITVAGCWIGVDTSGATSMGNGDDGIEIFGAYNTIGGTGANDGNVITNSNDEGINLTGGAADGNFIVGNIIGLNPDGTTGSGNTDVGIAVLPGAEATTIGGVTPAHRNVISLNYEGIEINTADNAVLGNYIGTDSSGTLDRGNQNDDGVELQSGNALRNRIGDTLAGAGNLIAFNTRNGVNLVGGNSNSVLGNRIHTNDLRGIDLGNNGVTPNDSADGDNGVNRLQNYPTLDAAYSNGTDTVLVHGALNSVPNNDFLIQFFSSAAADPTGYGEGESFVADTILSTDSEGLIAFTSTLTAAVPTGHVISATATDTAGNTSEFSDTVLIQAMSTLSVSVSKPVFAFGIAPANQWMSPDSSLVINNSPLAENFVGQISTFTDGSNTWDVSNTANGADSIRAQWSTASATGPWSDISAYASDFTIGTNVAVSDTVTVWFRIQTPASTTSFNQHASTLTVTAEQF